MIPFRKSIAFRLLLVSFILLSLPLLVDSFVIIQGSYKDALRDAKGYLVEVAMMRELPLSEMQPAKRDTLVLLESFLDLQKNFPTKPSEETNLTLKKLAQTGNYQGITLFRRTDEGKFIVVAASNPRFIGNDYTETFHTLKIFSPEAYQQGYFTFLSYDPLSFQPYFFSGRVIFSEKDQTPLGIIVVSANIAEKLEDLLTPDFDRYAVQVALVLPNTIVFAASDPSLKFQHFAVLDPESKEMILKQEPFAKNLLSDEPIQKLPTEGYPFIEFIWKGKEQIGYFEKINPSNLSLLVYANKNDIFSRPLFAFIDIYTVYILILIIGGSIAFLFTRRLARPMMNLSRVMSRIQRGDLRVRYQSDPLGYEINMLGEIFNEMIETLLQKKLLLQQERIERETYAQELRIGQQVQRSLLVEKVPSYPGVELVERYIPAKEVGGDFFDLFIKKRQGKDVLALAIADASGKGVRACFYSLGVRSMLRSYAQEFDDVAHVMSETNQLFCLDAGDSGMFVTALMGYYDEQTRSFEYFSCGHNPALLRRADGKVYSLDHLGRAIGLASDMQATAHQVILEKGDLVLLYTDGITEAHDVNYRMFSEERLVQFLEKKGGGEAGEVADKLLEELKEFVGEAPQHDDITLLILKVK